jgi:hypothetical protein
MEEGVDSPTLPPEAGRRHSSQADEVVQVAPPKRRESLPAWVEAYLLPGEVDVGVLEGETLVESVGAEGEGEDDEVREAFGLEQPLQLIEEGLLRAVGREDVIIDATVKGVKEEQEEGDEPAEAREDSFKVFPFPPESPSLLCASVESLTGSGEEVEAMALLVAWEVDALTEKEGVPAVVDCSPPPPVSTTFDLALSTPLPPSLPSSPRLDAELTQPADNALPFPLPPSLPSFTLHLKPPSPASSTPPPVLPAPADNAVEVDELSKENGRGKDEEGLWPGVDVEHQRRLAALVALLW